MTCTHCAGNQISGCLANIIQIFSSPRAKTLNIISLQGHADQNHNEIPFTSARVAVIKRWIITSVDKDAGKLELLYVAGGNVKLVSRFGKQFDSSSNGYP